MLFMREIKFHRLLLAIVLTFIVADTAPHPNLSPGALESLWGRLQILWEGPTDEATTAIAQRYWFER